MWTKKVKTLGCICKDTKYKPCAIVYIDQLKSTHNVLLPQSLVNLKSTMILDDQVMVYYLIDLVYVHIMWSIIQEENLMGETAFE